MPIATVNPANGETLKTYDALSAEEIEHRLATAEAAFHTHRTTSFAERAQLLHRAADLLEGDAQDIARVMTTEMGKPVKQARAEAAKCAKAMHWYADHAEKLLSDEEGDTADAQDSGASRVLVRYRPLGPVLAVMPWNFPLWQVIRFAAPALMAGNVGLLKHASNVPQTALYLEDLFRRAGYPEGCFQTLLIGSGAVEDILRDPRVKAATLTGSEPAGRAVASVAGDEVKKTVLELGGSDPYVVMPSADVERAAQVAVTARVQNNGQSCIAAKRFIVHTDVFDAFAERFTAGMKALTVGDPWTRTRTSARSPPNRAAATWRSSSTTPSRAARPSCAAASAPTGPAGTTRRPSSPTSPPRCASTWRRPSDRWRRSTVPPISTRPWRSPTTRRSG